MPHMSVSHMYVMICSRIECKYLRHGDRESNKCPTMLVYAFSPQAYNYMPMVSTVGHGF